MKHNHFDCGRTGFPGPMLCPCHHQPFWPMVSIALTSFGSWLFWTYIQDLPLLTEPSVFHFWYVQVCSPTWSLLEHFSSFWPQLIFASSSPLSHASHIYLLICSIQTIFNLSFQDPTVYLDCFSFLSLFPFFSGMSRSLTLSMQDRKLHYLIFFNS